MRSDVDGTACMPCPPYTYTLYMPWLCFPCSFCKLLYLVLQFPLPIALPTPAARCIPHIVLACISPVQQFIKETFLGLDLNIKQDEYRRHARANA